MNPALTSEQAQNFLQQSATADGFTGPVPNPQWGYGKLNILGALDLTSQVAQCTYSLNAGAAQQTIILNAAYPNTANKRGMVQFAVPSSGPISMIGIRVGTIGATTTTTIPIVATANSIFLKRKLSPQEKPAELPSVPIGNPVLFEKMAFIRARGS